MGTARTQQLAAKRYQAPTDNADISVGYAKGLGYGTVIM